MNDEVADRSAAPRVGRPADPGIDVRVTEAAMVVIAESGWRGLTFDNVATRAGVARSTLYRRHGTVGGLMLVVMDGFYTEAPVTDTGSLHGDLTALMGDVRRIWATPMNRSYLAALVAALDEDERIAAAYGEQLRRRRLATSMILDRAISRREARKDADPELILDLLAGFTAQRMLFRRQPLTAQVCAALVDLVCAAVAVGST